MHVNMLWNDMGIDHEEVNFHYTPYHTFLHEFQHDLYEQRGWAQEMVTGEGPNVGHMTLWSLFLGY